MKTTNYHFTTMRGRWKLLWRAIQCMWTGSISFNSGTKPGPEPHTGGPGTGGGDFYENAGRYTPRPGHAVYSSRPMTEEERKAVDAAFEEADKAFAYVDKAFTHIDNIAVKGHRRVMPRPSIFRGKK